MEPADILNFLREHSDWLSHATFWRNIGQMLLFGILKVLYRIANLAESLIDAVLLARNFLENETINQIFEGMLIFSASLTTLTLLTIATRKLWNPRVDLKGPFIRGVFVVALIASVPGLLVRGLEVSINAFDHTRVLGTEEQTSVSMAIIRENVADMHFIANHARGFDILYEATSTKNNLNDETIWHVDFAEVLTPDDISSSSPLHALRYTTSLDSEGDLGISRISNRWLDLFDEGYFRWTANWGVLYTTMPIISFFMFCTAFMLLTTVLDLIFLKIIVPILAPTDLETGQKMKHIATDALSAMLSIALIGVSLSIFRILLGLIFELDINFVARLIYLSVAVTTCMKGSAAFGKYLGVDVGMGSGWKSMLKLGATGLTAAKIATGGAKLTRKGVQGVQNGIPKAKEGVQKMSEGTKNAVGTVSESIGQMGAEFAGLGAKDFMKVKAMNTKESLKDGLAKANPINKMKSSFNENMGDKFKEGESVGDAKAIEGLTKLSNQEATDKRMDTIKARAEKAKQYDPNASLPKFGANNESHRYHESYQTNDDPPIDIFKGSDIPLSNGTAISDFTAPTLGELKDSDSKFTLPQFGLEKSPSETDKRQSNPFDQVKGVSDLNDLKPLKPKNKVIPKADQSAKIDPTPKPTEELNDLNTKSEMPTPKVKSVSKATTKAPVLNMDTSVGISHTPHIDASKPRANAPKVTTKANVPSQVDNVSYMNAKKPKTNAPKVTTKANVHSQVSHVPNMNTTKPLTELPKVIAPTNGPKQTVSVQRSGEDHHEE